MTTTAPASPPAPGVPATATAVRRTGWAAVALYALVALEFFYMATPFAAFFYTALRPGLDALAHVPGGGWLASFFLPHYAETRSTLLDAHEAMGLALFLVGLFSFIAGAVQIYGAKIRQRGAVTGGVYRLVRHPQYAALMVSGLGMVLVWPRYLVLALFVTLVFAYRGLAAIEETECAARFGAPYLAYLARTRRFLPWPVRSRRPAAASPLRGLSALVGGLARWVVALVTALVLARAAQGLALSALYLHETGTATWLSLVGIPDARLAALAAAAERDPRVAAPLAAARARGASLLVYVLPAGNYVSEVPMRRPSGAECHGVAPEGLDRCHVLVMTEVATDGGPARGAELLRRAVARKPLLEVSLDGADRVKRIDPPLEEQRYAGSPVPVW